MRESKDLFIPSTIYGTEVKSALKSMNVTRRVPLSMRDPRVGHWLADRFEEGGEYESESTPAAWKTLPNCDAGRSSLLTINKDTTEVGFRQNK